MKNKRNCKTSILNEPRRSVFQAKKETSIDPLELFLSFLQIEIEINSGTHIPVGYGDDFHVQAPQFLPE